MNQQAVVFDSAIEGVMRSFGKRFSDADRQALNVHGIDLKGLQSAYPLDGWISWMTTAGSLLYPSLAPHEQWRKLGNEFMDGFIETLLGRAALAMARLIGPKKTLLRMARNFKTATNYIECETTVVSENEVRIRVFMNPEFLGPWRNKTTPFGAYRRGVLEGTMRVMGITGASVDVLESNTENQSNTYVVRWPAA